VFIDVREHRLDLSSHAFAWELEAARAPLVSAERCFHEHDWGPLEHPRRRSAVGATARCRPSFPGRGQSPDGHEARGRGVPLHGIPRDDCSPRRLRPNLDLLRMPPVAAVALSPCPE
jgi:hypothetical protein